MAFFCLGLWALALWLKLNPVLGYCRLGGVWGSLTQIWAIYRGVVTKPLMLQGASPVAAVIIAFFAYFNRSGFYSFIYFNSTTKASIFPYAKASLLQSQENFVGWISSHQKA
jgi:hypothetical protein